MTKTGRIILYVEDEEADRYLMLAAFACCGFEGALQTVSDGRLALEYLSAAGAAARSAPDVILLDLNLPEIHGFDVLKWIRAHPLHCQLPIVVFTSSQREEDRMRAKLLGANDFFLKPSSFTGFQEVARILAARYLTSPLLPSQPGVAGSAAPLH